MKNIFWIGLVGQGQGEQIMTIGKILAGSH